MNTDEPAEVLYEMNPPRVCWRQMTLIIEPSHSPHFHFLPVLSPCILNNGRQFYKKIVKNFTLTQMGFATVC